MKKTFGGTVAVDDVSFEIYPGEVLALLGENGAGKSTLIKILAGVHQPDQGEIRFDGAPYTPRSAGGRVSFIHQDLGLIEWMTVAENIAIYKGYRRPLGLIDWRATSREAVEALSVVAGDIDPDRRIQELSRTEKSLVAIARAVSMNASVLVLDEPTASLPKDEVDVLFKVLRRLRERGVAIIYVSHRLDEVMAISDRLAVLRDGRLVGVRPTRETNPDALVQMIIGRPPESLFVRPPRPSGDTALKLEGLMVDGIGPVDCTIGKGEIVAFVGLRGAGQEDIGRAVFGDRARDAGSVVLDGRALELSGPRSAIANGIGFVAGDRTSDSVAHRLTVRENMFLNPAAGGRSLFGLRTPASEAAETRRLGERVTLSPNDPDAPMETLSGGNQQKVVFARWMRIGGAVLILEDPTAGVDVGAKGEIYRLLGAAVSAGLTLILISTDFEEVCAICHRALVFRDGRIVATLDQDELSMERLTHAAALVEPARATPSRTAAAPARTEPGR
ncbi:sugar ABC transporter ATP-binding protein [Acuticoccus sp. MNP-M23]|uniref:sugar ABC transporter ATP-binding protein n=1 Tax=Acuticoccus sp. MNP-M23 TaxID=3072793 RepID=UPI0035C23A6A